MATDELKCLSEEQINCVLEFANGLYNGITNGFQTPFTQNQNLINLTNTNGNKPTLEMIQNALNEARTNPMLAQKYSEFESVCDTIYSKVIDYYASILAFDLTITCTNIKNPSEYRSKEYQMDLKRVYKFLDKFDYKQEFAKVIKRILTIGIGYYWLRDSHCNYNDDTDALEIEKDRNFALQILPQNECVLTGYFNQSSFLFDFNMSYFLNSSVDIRLFDSWFIEQYNKIWKQDGINYNPSAPLSQRDGMFANYVQTSPVNGAWAFKWDTSNFYTFPPFGNLLKSAVTNDTIVDLQMDKDLISAYLILAGEIGMMDASKSGNKQNETKFSPKALGEFMNLVTKGLKKNVKTVAMPTENIRGWQYNDQNPNMVTTHLTTSASQATSASRLIYSDGKMSQSEMQNAILTDYNRMRSLYYQFNNFLNFFVNRKTKKYKFNFIFDGSNYSFERENRQKGINELSAQGLTLNESAWSSAYGYRPQDFSRMLEEAKNGNLQDKLMLLMNKNTMTQEEGQVGNPKKSDNEVSDNGETSRDYE